MGHVFQAKWWEKHPRGVFIWFIMAKGNWQRLWKGKEALIGILFMKIMEIGEKEGEMSQVACEEENKGK